MAPRPGVAIPQVGQDMDGRRCRATIYDRNAAQDILRAGFGVLDGDVKIAALFKCLAQGIDQFVLGRCASSLSIFLHQLCVGELDLRIFVEHFHVRVGRSAVQIVVILFHIFAVVALQSGQAKESLLQDRVALIPKGNGQTQVLEPVAHSGQAVFVPAVGPAAGVIMGKICPGLTCGGIILAHGTPSPLTEVRPPVFPVSPPRRRVGQPLLFGTSEVRHLYATPFRHCLAKSAQKLADNRALIRCHRPG